MVDEEEEEEQMEEEEEEEKVNPPSGADESLLWLGTTGVSGGGLWRAKQSPRRKSKRMKRRKGFITDRRK